jgi:hypothetical protein
MEHKNLKDLTGKVFGRWTVVARAPNRGRITMWVVRCECGGEKSVRAQALVEGHSTSCGCAKVKVTRETVVSVAALYRSKLNHRQIAERMGLSASHVGNLLRGDYWAEIPREKFAPGLGGYATNGLAQTTHGHSTQQQKSPEYKCWQSMKARCSNPKLRAYKHYGGRGIQVCERWKASFENFLADMGPRPSLKHSIERKRVNEGYEPGNCYWGTHSEQANNKRTSHRITIDGETLTMAQWAERMGVRTCVIMSRLRRGWPARDAVLKPRKFKRLAA